MVTARSWHRTITSVVTVAATSLVGNASGGQRSSVGREAAVIEHLRDGQELTLPVSQLVEFGKKLFSANWTAEDGAGRPVSNGRGKALRDTTRRLDGLRAFNRVSGPDANSCMGCHHMPFQSPGGGGDIVNTVFAGAERFDFATFDRRDSRILRGSLDKQSRAVHPECDWQWAGCRRLWWASVRRP